MKNENFKKMKETSGDIIILHKCPKNHDYMLYCSWNMACDGCNCCFSFWAIFCPFYKKINLTKKKCIVCVYMHNEIIKFTKSDIWICLN